MEMVYLKCQHIMASSLKPKSASVGYFRRTLDLCQGITILNDYNKEEVQRMKQKGVLLMLLLLCLLYQMKWVGAATEIPPALLHAHHLTYDQLVGLPLTRGLAFFQKSARLSFRNSSTDTSQVWSTTSSYSGNLTDGTAHYSKHFPSLTTSILGKAAGYFSC